ncbi:1,2-phenylacetyl-CoA epoxidase subunit PaaD [Geomicrobium sediminis]|uniref:Ring-1,2-phenylacetyl-CoA epoxidase subunit PaaD n=1 Tax=Geomicrobium sediminis TaxID=1347788 RepID=A0ABS2PAK1_9BACL|nr:ring-1,2-phenylacetyl-CoA epoxidase subunit PaaD [Geomicrobium sediminis]
MSSTREEEVMKVLGTVDDPELAGVRIRDLGMVREVAVCGGDVRVILVPTFVGCPALTIIEKNVKEALCTLPWLTSCDVSFSFETMWSTEQLTDEGKENLKKNGIAPPPTDYVEGEEWHVDCPYCDSPYVSMDNVFGPTACRSILYCRSCRNPFEAMKPVVPFTLNNALS